MCVVRVCLFCFVSIVFLFCFVYALFCFFLEIKKKKKKKKIIAQWNCAAYKTAEMTGNNASKMLMSMRLFENNAAQRCIANIFPTYITPLYPLIVR